MAMLKRFFIVAAILGAGLLAIVVWGVVSFRSHPISSLEKMSRPSLRLGGGERHTLDVPVAIVGNSLGGWVAMLYTLEHAADVRHLILENAGGISVDYKGPSFLPASREEARAVVDATLARETPVPDFILDDLDRRAPTSQIARMADENFASYLLDEALKGRGHVSR